MRVLKNLLLMSFVHYYKPGWPVGKVVQPTYSFGHPWMWCWWMSSFRGVLGQKRKQHVQGSHRKESGQQQAPTGKLHSLCNTSPQGKSVIHPLELTPMRNTLNLPNELITSPGPAKPQLCYPEMNPMWVLGMTPRKSICFQKAIGLCDLQSRLPFWVLFLCWSVWMSKRHSNHMCIPLSSLHFHSWCSSLPFSSKRSDVYSVTRSN